MTCLFFRYIYHTLDTHSLHHGTSQRVLSLLLARTALFELAMGVVQVCIVVIFLSAFLVSGLVVPDVSEVEYHNMDKILIRRLGARHRRSGCTRGGGIWCVWWGWPGLRFLRMPKLKNKIESKIIYSEKY